MTTARRTEPSTVEIGPDEVAARRAAQALHPAGSRTRALDGDVLAAIAEGLAAVVDHGQTAAPGVVRRTRLLDTTGYDVWLLVWGPGAVADDHDHAGSVGVVQVVAGELTETAADLVDHGRDRRRTLGTTHSSTLPATGRHTLANLTDTACVSVHVYSPPLGEPDLGDPHLA